MRVNIDRISNSPSRFAIGSIHFFVIFFFVAFFSGFMPMILAFIAEQMAAAAALLLKAESLAINLF